MKSSLAAGLAIVRELIVDRERTIGFMGEAARVYATPMMVRDIEMTCRELLLAAPRPGRGFGRHARRDRSSRGDAARHDGEDRGEGHRGERTRGDVRSVRA
jgi:hypothetical protein